MRLPAVRAHVGIVTCAVLGAVVLGTPFPDPPAPPTARDGIVLSGADPTPPVAPPSVETPPVTEPPPEPPPLSLVPGRYLLWHDTV